MNQIKNKKEDNSGKRQIGSFKHFIILLIVASVTITIMLALYRPDVLEDVWLWIIGLIGPIIALIRRAISSVHSYIRKFDKNNS
jgi:hypothetical protein